MFKKKPIYIILLIIFTLLLCADAVVYVQTASAEADTSSNKMNMEDFDPSQMQDGERPEGNEDFDPSQMQDGERPEGEEDFDPSQMQDGERPEGEEGAEPPQMQDGERPEGDEDFDPSQMQDGERPEGKEGAERSQMQASENDTESSSGFLDSIKSFFSSWWLPIGIICLVVDAICIYMLIRISKKKIQSDGGSAGQETEMKPLQDSKPKISSYEKRRRKKRRTTWIIGSVLAVIVLVIGGFLIVRSAYEAQIAQAESVTVVSAEASGTAIDTVISGTGTLEEDDVDTVIIPDGVEIVAYYVENGDTVETGDVLASVDHTSVVKTIAEVQAAMDALDEDIEEVSDDDIASTIEAASDGRVKAVYAQEEVDVSETMYEHGALMLISLDGLMAADIETEAEMTTGDSVTVLLTEGTEAEGRVDSTSNGVVTVTVTDDGTVYGEEVTVSDESGSVIGSAPLYIHSELKVTGYAGTVSSITADENEEVDTGDTLVKLTDTEYTAEYELLIDQRREYEEVMMSLFKLYQDNKIYAEFEGIVADIDEESAAEYAQNTEAESSDGNTQTSATGMLSLSQSVATLTYTPTEQTTYILADSTTETDNVVALGNNPGGVDDTTVATYSNFAGTVTDVTYGSLTLNGCYVNVTDYSNYEALGITAEMMTEPKQISPAASTPVYMFENGAWVQHSANDIGAGDVLILTYDNNGETQSLVWIIIASKAEVVDEEPGGQDGAGGSGGTSSSPAVSPSSDEDSEEELYEILETVVMSITPSEKMNVTFTIDELDILSLEIGQEAIITLDAIDGEILSGTVTDIDMTGTNSGGSTKYTAVVTLDKTDEMIAGMNAAVNITISSAQCDVAIPVAAIVESGTESYVYTSYDDEDQTLGGLVTVSTGLSDGANVEIISGLDAGSEVWYEYNDSVNISSSVVDSSSGGGFNIMRMLGGK